MDVPLFENIGSLLASVFRRKYILLQANHCKISFPHVMNKTTLLVFACILGAALYTFLFISNSFFRPFAGLGIELSCALVTIVFMSVNGAFFFKRTLAKRDYIIYIWVLLLLAVLPTILEFVLTFPNTMHIFEFDLASPRDLWIITDIFINILVRNLVCFGIVDLVCTIAFLNWQNNEIESTVRDKTDCLVVYQGKMKCVVNSGDVSYCCQNGNYADIFMTNGINYTKYTSLKNLHDLLGEGFVQISKRCIVNASDIERFDEDAIILRSENGTVESRLPVGKQYKELIAEHMQRTPPPVQRITHLTAAEKKSPYRRVSSISNPKERNIYSYIIHHPNCKMDEIIGHTGIPRSTMSRFLKDLLSNGHIVYQGSKRYGGYEAANDEVGA